MRRVFKINFLILLCSLCILELIFGHWFGQDYRAQLHLLTNQQRTLDVSRLYQTDLPCIRYTRDIYGLRGHYSDTHTINILTVGGSTTDQRYIDDHQTWQSVLEQALRIKGYPAIMANAGVDGQTTWGHLKNFEWWFPQVPHLHPKIIIFYIGINDFDTVSGDGAIPDTRHPFKVYLQQHSALWHLARTLYGMHRARTQQLNHHTVDFSQLTWETEPRQTNHMHLVHSDLAAYQARIQALITQTRAQNATPVFITQPTRMVRLHKNQLEGIHSTMRFHGTPINGLDYYDIMTRMNNVLKETAEGYPVIDLTALHIWEDDDFYDFVHMTPQGTQKLGQAIAAAWPQSLVF